MKAGGSNCTKILAQSGSKSFGEPKRLWRMLDDLGRPSERLGGPVFVFPLAVVSSIQPDMTHPRKLGCSPID